MSSKFIVILLAIQLVNVFSAPAVEPSSTTKVVTTSTSNVDVNALLQNESIRNLLLLLGNQGTPTKVVETKPIEKTTKTTTVTETVTNPVEQPAVNTVIVENPPQIGSRITEVTATEAPASNSVVPVQPAVVVTYEPAKPVEKTTTTVETVSVPVQPEVVDRSNTAEALLNSLTTSTTTVTEPKRAEAVPYLFGSQPNTFTLTSTSTSDATATPTLSNTETIINELKQDIKPMSTAYVMKPTWETIHKPTEEELKQERNAKYQFASLVEDGISGSFQERAEVRQNGVVYGKWSYDDGSNFRSTSYQADANGYRIIKQEVLPTRIKSLTGQAHVQESMNGRSMEYRITENDIGALSRKGKLGNTRLAVI